MSTTTALRSGLSSAEQEEEILRQHLDACLRELWADLPAPVWVADARGRIVYANYSARDACNGAGLRQASARIAEVLQGEAKPRGEAAAQARSAMEISPLIDGRGRRVGWLAIGAPQA
ncbi:MAG: PAS domain-containing protein [Phycisphaerae bacterium]